MPQISTTDNPVEAIHHMVVNDRCETVQHVAAPSDFYLFPKVKFHLRGQRFDGNDDVIYAVEANLGGPDATFFHKGKIKLEHHWNKYTTEKRRRGRPSSSLKKVIEEDIGLGGAELSTVMRDRNLWRQYMVSPD
ncbi:hypothetical protein Bbelb_339080 [Branchiostoma belcheri]|nr:hypothetical protein Bbelb_339080 [Branchiostoma belcheri]